ncbi:MAG: hypothetical protein ACFCBW_14445 [Candidatus Competibacterales bacterium]
MNIAEVGVVLVVTCNPLVAMQYKPVHDALQHKAKKIFSMGDGRRSP